MTVTAYAPLPNESAKAYAAFCAYRDGGDKRTLLSVAIALGKSATLMGRWSSRNKWRDRIRSMSASIDKVTEANEAKKLAGKAGVWAERAEAVRESQYEMAGILMEKAKGMLKWPLAKTTSADGLTVIHPVRWAMGDAARVVDVAARLQCLATERSTGQSTSTSVTVNVTPPSMDQQEARLREVFGLTNERQ